MAKNLTGVANTADYNLGRGRLYAADINPTTGKPAQTGWRFMGNAPAFTLTMDKETLDHFASTGGLKTKDKSVVVSQGMNVAFGLDEINDENLALWLSGTQATYTNPAATLQTDVVLATTAGGGVGIVQGRWYDLQTAAGLRLYDVLTANLLVENATPTTAVLGTDYLLDNKMGRIFVIVGSVVLAAGLIMTFTYTADAGAKDCDEVRGLVVSNKVQALKFIAENPANADKQTEFEFHQVSISSDGDLAMIGDEFTVANFTGVAEKNELGYPTSPYLTVRSHLDS